MWRRVCGIALMCALGAPALQREAAGRLFEQARQAFEEQRWDQARAAAQQALAADPAMGDAEVLLGLIATAQSRFPEAQQHFERAVTLQPRNYQAHAYLGSTYLQENRPAEAAEAFRRVLQLDPGNLTASYNLGVIALAQRQPAEALARFAMVTRARPSDVTAWMGLLESRLLLRQTAEARQALQHLLALLADRDPRLVQVAALLAEHGDSASAIPVLERALRASPGSYELSYNLALACLQTQQYARAGRALAPFAAQGKAEALNLLGSIEEKQSHPAEADRAFEEAARREPGNADYRFDYGNSLLQHGKIEAALAVFRSAAADLPQSWKLRVGLGSACYLSGDYEQAAQALLAAVALKPDAMPAYYLLGEAYDSAPRLQPAILEAFRGYLRAAPPDAWAYYHYGAMLYARAQAERREDHADALASLRQATRLDPSLAEAYLQLGIIAMAEGRPAESLPLLEKAVRLAPRLAAARYRLALAYQRLGQAARAKQEMEQFRALQNAGPDRGRVLSSLASVGR